MKKLLATIFLLAFSIYFFSWLVVDKLGVNKLSIQSEDTVPALFLPLTILKSGTLYLDEYYPMMLEKYPNPDDRDQMLGMVPFYLRKVGEHYVSAFPIITPLLALPVYFVALNTGVDINWDSLAVLAHLSSALIMAAAVVAFFILLHKKLNLDKNKSILLTFVYAFATINYAHISQAMWQHGTVQLFTILALWFYKDRTPADLMRFGLFMGLAVLSRPTAALVLLVLALPLVLNRNFIKNSLHIAAGLSLPVLFFVWYNAKFYISIENQGYANQLLKNWLGDFPLSFVGVWLSPSKGILIYSPVIAFSLVGAWIAYKTKQKFYILVALIVLLHTLIISFWKHWFGGWSFGYRMSSDVIPFMVLLIVPWLQKHKTGKLFISAIAVSVAVQLFGMVFFDGIWHAAYDRGFKDRSWLWSVKDSEFAFNMRRSLVKVGYLEQACPWCAK